MLTAPLVVVALVVLVASAAAGSVLVAEGRAQDAADEAAIAVARAAWDGAASPCTAGSAVLHRVAGRATLVSCRTGPDLRSVVTIEVPVTSPLARALGVTARRGTAAAAAAQP